VKTWATPVFLIEREDKVGVSVPAPQRTLVRDPAGFWKTLNDSEILRSESGVADRVVESGGYGKSVSLFVFLPGEAGVLSDSSLGSLDCLHVHRHILEAGVGHAARNERLALLDVLSEFLVVEAELSDAGQLGARGGC
jgi:hypothetical protein